MKFSVRAAVESDAEQVAALSDEFSAYLRSLGDTTDFQFSADAYRRDGFGSAPAFFGLVAQSREKILGYLLYHHGYDVDFAARVLHVIDLYVREEYRMHSVGKALMGHAKQICKDNNIKEMIWSVYKSNSLAPPFYEQLGAKYITDLRYMYLEVDA